MVQGGERCPSARRLPPAYLPSPSPLCAPPRLLGQAAATSRYRPLPARASPVHRRTPASSRKRLTFAPTDCRLGTVRRLAPGHLLTRPRRPEIPEARLVCRVAGAIPANRRRSATEAAGGHGPSARASTGHDPRPPHPLALDVDHVGVVIRIRAGIRRRSRSNRPAKRLRCACRSSATDSALQFGTPPLGARAALRRRDRQPSEARDLRNVRWRLGRSRSLERGTSCNVPPLLRIARQHVGSSYTRPTSATQTPSTTITPGGYGGRRRRGRSATFMPSPSRPGRDQIVRPADRFRRGARAAPCRSANDRGLGGVAVAFVDRRRLPDRFAVDGRRRLPSTQGCRRPTRLAGPSASASGGKLDLAGNSRTDQLRRHRQRRPSAPTSTSATTA